MRGVARLLSFAATLGIAVAALASDRVVRDDARHFQFERTETWMPFDAEPLDDIRAKATELAATLGMLTGERLDFAVIDSFGAPCGEDDRSVLCVTATYNRWTSPPRTYAGLGRRYSKEMADAAAVFFANLGLPVGVTNLDFAVDRLLGRVTCHGTVTSDEIGALPMYSIGLPGKEGIVWLHALARPQDAGSARTVVEGIVASFRWDEGYEFREEVVVGGVVGPHPWRDDANRWSVTVPDGWTQSPPRSGDSSKCVAGFGPPGAEFGFDPYVLAGWIPAEFHSVSWEDFQSAATCIDLEGMISRSSVAFGGIKSTVMCDPSVFDKYRGRMTTTYSMEFVGFRWKGVFVDCFGHDGGAVFAFCAREKDFAEAQPKFDALMESFRFDDGYRWEDMFPVELRNLDDGTRRKDAFPVETIDWAAVFRKAAKIAGVLALGAVAVWAVVWVVRARRSKADVARARERLMRSEPESKSRGS